MCNLLVVQSLGSGIPSTAISTVQSFPSQVMGTSQVTVCTSQPKVFHGIPTSLVQIDNREKKENKIIPREDVIEEVSKLLQEVSATVENLVEISSKLNSKTEKEILITNETSNELEVSFNSEDIMQTDTGIDDKCSKLEETLEASNDTKYLSNDNQDVQVSSSKDFCDYNSPMSIENFHETCLNLRLKKKVIRVEEEGNSMDSFVPMSLESEFLSSINSESGRSDTEQSLGVRDETSMDVDLEYSETKPNIQEVWKCAVSPTGDRIYVINNAQHKLLALSPDGTLLSSFTDTELRHPWCVCVTPAGQVVVGLFSANSIIQVEREGRRQLATVATRTGGLGFPLSVCYNINRNAIIVGLSDQNKILVLELE